MSVPKHQEFCKVFWPHELTSKPSGFIVGWNLQGFICCVATVISDLSLQELEEALHKLEADPTLTGTFRQMGGAPIVLGEWLQQGDGATRAAADAAGSNETPVTPSSAASTGRSPLAESDEEEPPISPSNAKKIATVSEKKQSAAIWLVVEGSTTAYPVIGDLFCCGLRYPKASQQIILFERPSPPYYLSTVPLSLDLKRYERDQPEDAGTDLEFTLRQINGSLEIENKVLETIRRSPVLQNSLRPRRSMLQTRLHEGQTQILVALLTGLLVGLRMLSAVLLWVLCVPVPGTGRRVAELCTLGVQLELRLRNFCDLPYKWDRIKKKKSKSNHAHRAHRVSFHNSVCLIFIDVLLGITAYVVLVLAADSFLHTAHRVHTALAYNVVRSQVHWLMGWPAGLKLNDNLDNFLGMSFLKMIDQWDSILSILTPHAHTLLYILGATGVGGISLLLAVAADVIALSTLHVMVIYRIAAMLFKLQLDVLLSLWQLFRGRKYNMLRKRVDSSDYELDQLLLGTLLFTVLFFLFPTTAVYYALFSVVQAIFVCIQLSLASFRTLLNSFPIYPIAMYFLDSTGLPGGVGFEFVHQYDDHFDDLAPRRTQPVTRLFNWMRSDGLQAPPPKAGSSNLTYLWLSNRTLPVPAVLASGRRGNTANMGRAVLSTLRAILSGKPELAALHWQVTNEADEAPHPSPSVREFHNFVSSILEITP